MNSRGRGLSAFASFGVNRFDHIGVIRILMRKMLLKPLRHGLFPPLQVRLEFLIDQSGGFAKRKGDDDRTLRNLDELIYSFGPSAFGQVLKDIHGDRNIKGLRW